MKRLRATLVLVLLLVPSSHAGALRGEDDLGAFEVPGGVHALVARTTGRVAEIVVAVQAGTRHESAQQQGAAAIVADAMLVGEWSGQSIRRILARHGATPEIRIGHGTATFRFVLPASETREVVRLLARLFTRDSLPTAAWAVALQRGTESLSRARVDPSLCASALFPRLVWEAPGGGGDLRAVSMPALVALEEFRRAHYKPHRMSVGVAAAHVTGLRSAIREAFTAPPHAALRSPAEPPQPALRAAALTRHVPAAASPFLIVGHAIPIQTSGDFFATQLLAGVLGGSLTARLHQRLRVEERLVYTVEAEASPVGPSHLLLRVSCQTADPARARHIIEEELRSLSTRPVAGSELKAAAAILRSRLRLDQSSTRSSLYRLTVRNPSAVAPTPEEGLAWLEMVTPEALLTVARRLLRPDALIAVIGGDGPRGCPDDDLGGCTSCG